MWRCSTPTRSGFCLLKFGLKGSMNLSDGSTMDDFDFNLLGCPPPDFTCHSNHPGTRLRQARMFDVYGSADFYRSGGLTLSALAGYKDTFYQWAAIGGTANYGPLPPGLGISYEQSWSTPYIGLAFSSTFDAWTLSGRVIGSTWAKGDDKDNHHLRSLLFTEKFDSTNMVAADIGVAYRMNRFVSVTADYRFERWGTGKGPTSITDFLGGGTFLIPGDAAGANAVTHAFSLGLKIDLHPAQAAPGLKDSYSGPVASWSGWNVGIGGGFDWQRNGWTTTGLASGAVVPLAASANGDFDDNADRFAVFVGHSWQRNGFVFGLEGDFGKSNANSMHLGSRPASPVHRPKRQPLSAADMTPAFVFRRRLATLSLLPMRRWCRLPADQGSCQLSDGIAALSWCSVRRNMRDLGRNVG